MSENDNKSPLDDNKNEKDPYDFFKFVGPENDEKNKPNKNNGKRKFPFFGLLLLIFAAVAIVDVFVLAKSDGMIDFSDFRKKIEDGEIVSVEMSGNVFTGYGPEQIFDTTEESSKGIQLFKPEPAKVKTTYKTVGIIMPDFINLLNEKGVEYKFIVKNESKFLQLLYFLAPFIIIFVMYSFIFSINIRSW